jgi:hypothetical protein
LEELGSQLAEPAFDHVQPGGAGGDEVDVEAGVGGEPRHPFGDGSPVVSSGWTTRYAARRIAWHVLDHAWEMQDRAES